MVVSGISSRFRGLSQCEGQITHVLLTRSPLVYPRRGLTARLACVKHAASVRPEPGSNSPLKSCDNSPEGAVNSWSVLARDRITDSSSESSFLPKEPPTQHSPAMRTSHEPDGYQTNSSTFGTLLSSQGSSAHHSQASRPSRWGNLTKLTGSVARGQIRFRHPVPRAASLRRAAHGAP